ncbi:MAG: PD40 domain-containing protein [Bacteroidetes bacterium]|nr:PD40 domain-containing protein [Bacteroidota bacterium]
MRLRAFITVLLLIFCFNVSLIAQEEKCPPLSDARLQQLFKEAVETYKRFQYPRSASILTEITRREPDFAPAHYLMGLIYLSERHYRPGLAATHLERTLELCPQIDPYLYFHLGNIYFLDEAYDKAAAMYDRFVGYIDEIKDKDYFEAVQKFDKALFLHYGYSNPVPFNPKVVKGISTKNDEYLMTISADDQVALYTRRMRVKDQFMAWDTRSNYKEVFMQSYRRSDDSFDEGEPLPAPFNRQLHEGSPSLTLDNRTLYFTACEFENTYYNCNIHVSEYKDWKWTIAKKLPSNVNSKNSWESQPSISSDGKTLYFVSDREGRYDIYYTTKDKDGKWADAKPIGAPVNTSGNERSPFIHLDGRTLYFSSDGHMGFGGYDLFYSKKDDNGVWSKPENLGYPINTPADETGMIVSTDGSIAYFASTRFNETGEWNVYSFELYEKARPEKVLFITGEVQSDDYSGYSDVQLQLRNLETLEYKDVEVDTITGKYAIAEIFKHDYLLTLKKENYAYTSKLLTIHDTLLQSPAKVDIEMKAIEIGKTYKIQDIYFEYDKYTISKESKLVLYTLVEFLNDHPDVKLEIRGHTDNIGGETYNQTLSESRAKSVYNFLIQNKISSRRLKFKGFGQSLPVDTNDTEEGRANNRRTEFVILDK